MSAPRSVPERKISEPFLEFVAPALEGLDPEVALAPYQSALRIAELVSQAAIRAFVERTRRK